MGYIRKALEKGYLEHPGSACCTDDMFEIFIRFGQCLCCLLLLFVDDNVQYFHGAQPGAPTYRFDAEKRGWKFVQFDVPNSNMQEFGLAKTIC